MKRFGGFSGDFNEITTKQKKLICESIEYTDFRNIESEKLQLSPEVNVLNGENAQGKSNMLEGIYFFARGRSFRASKDRELIMFGKKAACLSLKYKKAQSEKCSELRAIIPAQGKKDISRNGAKLVSLKEMIGSFCAVLFCPAHLSLVDGGPSVRRSFLDIALSQLYPTYLDNLSRYQKALLNKSALLKEAQAGMPIDKYLYEIYDSELARSGARIAIKRCEYVNMLSASVESFFSEMTSGREKTSVNYKTDCLISEDSNLNYDEILENAEKKLLELLSASLEKDIRYGSVSVGIHRDDLNIKINSKDARLYASQGQRRSLALAMKLGEGEVHKACRGEYPVFLLDDVLSELDLSRRTFILGNLKNRQIIVTSCEKDHFSKENVNFINIEGGRIK